MKGFYIVLFITLILAACAPSEMVTPTAVPISTSTSTPLPATSTHTPLPTVTLTATMTPTATPLPAEITDDRGVPMVLVPAGEFTMGNDDGYGEEKPAHIVYLDTFYIDQTEVTHSQYAECVDVGACEKPHRIGFVAYPDYYLMEEYADYPIIRIDWNDAVTYCDWAGKRLPTEAEWEKAARGEDARLYPWGDSSPTCDLANVPACGREYLNPILSFFPVGSFPEGKSPYGAYDMIGNAWEWVSDWYDGSYYTNSPDKNPTGPLSGEARVLRGGSAFLTAKVTSRFSVTPDRDYFTISGISINGGSIAQFPSFRCAMDIAQ